MSLENKCDHCGLPLPASKAITSEDQKHYFCCHGCATVFSVLNSQGLQQYYELQQSLPEEKKQRAKVTQQSFAYFDHPDFQKKYVEKITPQQRRAVWHLDGVHCPACMWLVEKLPNINNGVQSCRLNLGNSQVEIVFNESSTTPSTIAQQLDTLGYTPQPLNSVEADNRSSKHSKRLLNSLAVAGFCAGNTMMLSVSLYQGWFSGIEERFVFFFQWASALIALPAILYSGQVFYQKAWVGLKNKTLHMDLPITVAILLSSVASYVNTFLGREHIYFDSIATFIFLLLIGRWLQDKSLEKARKSFRLDFSWLPLSATRICDDTKEDVPTESLNTGDIILIESGQSIPVDGQVTSGRTQVNEAVLTGEAQPVEKNKNDNVYAGTINLGSPFKVKVLRTGQETRAGKIIEQLKNPDVQTAPVMQLADRLSGYFIACILLLAIAAGVTWTLIADPWSGVDVAVALLVVACPCALGLATPLAITKGITAASKLGLFIKNADVFERLQKVTHVVFDKTGTLTEGQMSVIDSYFVENEELYLQTLVALEEHQQHPVAQAILSWGADTKNQANQRLPEFEKIHAHEGCGIEATDSRGRTFHLGSVSWLQQLGVNFPAHDWLERNETQGATIVGLAEGNVVKVLVALNDKLKPEVKQVVEALLSAGKEVKILSGDSISAVRCMVNELSSKPISFKAGLLPEDKLEYIRSLERTGKVMMVGDGVNDAVALKGSFVGVACQGGANISLHIAPVYLATSDLRRLLDLFKGSKKTLGVVRRNLIISIIYNSLGVTGAALGWINPLTAAIFMPLSSITVVLSSLLSKPFNTTGS